MIIKNPRIDIIIVNKTRYIVFVYSFLTIFIKTIELLSGRNFIFKLNQLNVLIFSINIFDHDFL